MKKNENEYDNTVDSTGAEVEKPSKKSIFAKVIIIALIIVFVVAGGLFALYSVMRSSPQVRNISKDALAVARIDFPMLLKKAGLTDPKKDDMLEDLREQLEEVNMEALIDNPKSTGLITARPSYIFAEQDKKTDEWFTYLVMPISSGKKLAKFMQGITPEDEDVEINVKQQKGKYILEIDQSEYEKDADKVFCAWTNSTLMLGLGIPNDMLDPEQKSAGKSVKKRVLQYLDQPKTECITANTVYAKAMKKKHDIALWVNTGELVTRLESGIRAAKDTAMEINKQQAAFDAQTMTYNAFDDPWGYDAYDPYSGSYGFPSYPEYSGPQAKNMYEKILDEANYGVDEQGTDIINELIDQLKLLKGSSFLTYSDYTKGKVLTSLRFTPSGELRRELQGIFEKLGDVKSLAKYLPREDLVGTATYRMNVAELWSFAERKMKKTLTAVGKEVGDKTMKRMKRIFDGSIVASVNVGDGKEKIPYFTMVGSIRKNTGIKDVIKDLAQDGDYKKSGTAYKNEYGDDAFIIEGDVVIWTSDHAQYKRSERGVNTKELNKSISLPVGAFLDIAKMLETVEDWMDDDVQSMLEEYLDIQVKCVSHNGLPDELVIVTNMKNKKENSLKVLWDMSKDNLENWDPGIFKKKEAELPAYEYPPMDTTASSYDYDYQY